MNYLFDTNIISELIRKNPAQTVIRWVNNIPNEHIYLSVITFGEICKGIQKVMLPAQKDKLLLWLENELTQQFHGRVLPISLEVADRWGRLQGEMTRTLPAIDSLIAATALHHDMTLVTRNIKDFTGCMGLSLVNPFYE